MLGPAMFLILLAATRYDTAQMSGCPGKDGSSMPAISRSPLRSAGLMTRHVALPERLVVSVSDRVDALPDVWHDGASPSST